MHNVYEQNGMKIRIFVVGMISTNCLVVSNIMTKQAFVIDPGDSPELMMKYIDEEGLTVEAVLLTHGHFDHIYGAEALAQKYDVNIYAHQEELPLLKDPVMNCSAMMGRIISISDITPLRDDQILDICGFSIKVLHTPGHTSGSVCYYCERTKFLFSGDTLFLESAGRTDFPTGSGATLLRSLNEKLAVLPDDITVFPGHGPGTTIEYEKKNNPYINL